MTKPVAPCLPQQQFGQNVRRLRLQSGLTQDVLAQRCSRFKKQIPHIEAGRVVPTLTMIVVLATALGVQPHRLLVGIGVALDIDTGPAEQQAAGQRG